MWGLYRLIYSNLEFFALMRDLWSGPYCTLMLHPLHKELLLKKPMAVTHQEQLDLAKLFRRGPRSNKLGFFMAEGNTLLFFAQQQGTDSSVSSGMGPDFDLSRGACVNHKCKLS